MCIAPNPSNESFLKESASSSVYPEICDRDRVRRGVGVGVVKCSSCARVTNSCSCL